MFCIILKMSSKKRVNFTQREKEFFLSILAKYKHIVEDKSTKAFMVDKKKKVWEQIETDYNCSAETGSRNSKQLKVLYENLKRENRKTLPKQHARLDSSNDCEPEGVKTSGDNVDILLSPKQEILLDEDSEETEPLGNECDTANDYFIDETEFNMDIEDSKPNLSHEDDPISVEKPQPTRKRKITSEGLKKQYYREKIKNEQLQRTVLNLQIKKLRLEIKKLRS